MAKGACNSGVSSGNIAIEIIHTLLVIWNIFTDIRLLLEMKSISHTYDKYVDIIATSPDDYQYTFCYPHNHIPDWYYNIDNTTLTTCDCTESSIQCANRATNDSKLISSDISCKPQIFGLRETCQQTLYINEWTCQECLCGYNSSTDISIYSKQSLPVQRFYYEYDTMTTIGYAYEYCDPYAIIDGKLSTENHLEILIKCSIAFLVIGIVAWLVTSIGRIVLLKWDEVSQYIHLTEEALQEGTEDKVKKLEKTYEHDAKMYLAGGRMLAGFIANLFHDIPHQIILLFFVRFLYSDYGYNCFEDFVHYPKINAVTFNSNEDMLVILARNYPIFSSVFAWTALVLFNAGWNTYQIYIELEAGTRANADTVLKDAKKAKCAGVCLFYSILTAFFFCYILSHWCWPAFVGYYFVAPALHKEWLILQIVFWGGAVLWGLGIIGLIIALLCFCYEQCC